MPNSGQTREQHSDSGRRPWQQPGQRKRTPDSGWSPRQRSDEICMILTAVRQGMGFLEAIYKVWLDSGIAARWSSCSPLLSLSFLTCQQAPCGQTRLFPDTPGARITPSPIVQHPQPWRLLSKAVASQVRWSTHSIMHIVLKLSQTLPQVGLSNYNVVHIVPRPTPNPTPGWVKQWQCGAHCFTLCNNLDHIVDLFNNMATLYQIYNNVNHTINKMYTMSPILLQKCTQCSPYCYICMPQYGAYCYKNAHNRAHIVTEMCTIGPILLYLYPTICVRI